MKLRKVGTVAVRELLATVLTKGFVIGVVFMPLLVLVVLAIVPTLIDAPPIVGNVAVIDASGAVADRLEERIPRGEALTPRGPGPMPVAMLSVERLAEGADVEAATRALYDAGSEGARLAVVVIPKDAAEGDAPFSLFVASRLDVLLQMELSARVGDAIVDARIRASGLDGTRVRKLVARPVGVTKVVTAAGAEDTNEIAAVLLPGAFMLLLWIASFTAGQFLLTSLVEEKSMRVMEVLLSAVSPLELLTGKIAGQTMVGLLVLATYAALGSSALLHFDLLHLLSLPMVGLLVFFFLAAFLMIASVMAAVGSVVDDMRSAQSLLAPILFVLTLPTLLWLPITRAPGSTVAVVLSFVPPVGPFVTVLRLFGSEPPPAWQVGASMATAAASAAGFIWAAGKVFQIGVLLYGKPPSFRTMWTWIRRA